MAVPWTVPFFRLALLMMMPHHLGIALISERENWKSSGVMLLAVMERHRVMPQMGLHSVLQMLALINGPSHPSLPFVFTSSSLSLSLSHCTSLVSPHLLRRGIQQITPSNIPVQTYLGETSDEFIVFLRTIPSTKVTLRLESKVLIIYGAKFLIYTFRC